MNRIIIGIVVLLALAAGGLWWFEARSMPVFFAEDAVRVLAYEASDIFHGKPATTQAELDQMIKSQHEASNINLKIDANGKAVDPFGTAFRVEHQTQSGKSITTVTSAGPDREFETGDDIRFKHEREMESQQSPAGDVLRPVPDAGVVQEINSQITQFNSRRSPDMGVTPITARVARVELADAGAKLACIDESGATVVVLMKRADGSFVGQMKTPYHRLANPEGHSWGEVILDIRIEMERPQSPAGGDGKPAPQP